MSTVILAARLTFYKEQSSQDTVGDGGCPEHPTGERHYHLGIVKWGLFFLPNLPFFRHPYI